MVLSRAEVYARRVLTIDSDIADSEDEVEEVRCLQKKWLPSRKNEGLIAGMYCAARTGSFTDVLSVCNARPWECEQGCDVI